MVSGLVKQNEEVPYSSTLQAIFNGLCLVKQNEVTIPSVVVNILMQMLCHLFVQKG